MKYLVLLLTLCQFSGIKAQQLSLEQIMKGHEFVGNLPTNPFWSWDSKRIYFEWNPENEPGNSMYFWEKGFDKAKKAGEQEKNDSYIPAYEQQNWPLKFYLRDGALGAYDVKTKKHIKVVQSQSYIHSLQINERSKKVYFVQDNNLFMYSNEAQGISSIVQLTNFKNGNKIPDQDESSFLNEQQQELFLYIKDQNKKANWHKENRSKKSFPKAYYYGKFQIENIQMASDEKHILFRLSKYAEGLETAVENHITKSGYTESDKAREKVSVNALSEHKMGIYNIEKDSVYFVDFSNLTNIRKNPSYLSLYANFKEYLDHDRAIVMHDAIFSPNGKHCVVNVKSLDNKDRWIVKVDLSTGKVEELEHQNDPAWIGGPGISEWNFDKGTLGFLANEDEIYFQSEKSGYSHLYVLNLFTKKKTMLTSGKWEVREVTLNKAKTHFYIQANKNHPGNREMYRVDALTGKMENVLTDDGANEGVLSPDEKSFAVMYSYKTKPWELYIADNKMNSSRIQITHSTTKEFEARTWLDPKVISFEATDKTMVNARLYEPVDKSKKNGAAVIFVHGAGYLQNAHNHWSYYFREYMFHNLLVEKGYTVLDIDYRASDGYGRDFRTGIYRFMGGLDLQDQLDGKKYLAKNCGIDSNRVGIYGGSYGGFITLMALMTKPGQFKCGAAMRSVTDWAHYNLEYTSNILNFPETDPEAYRKSSPIYYAENLKDNLLMLHGMVDDNVQFQDIIRMSERLIELQKDNWELAVYPVEAHGFKEAYSWLDEYKRILKLFEENLR